MQYMKHRIFLRHIMQQSLFDWEKRCKEFSVLIHSPVEESNPVLSVSTSSVQVEAVKTRRRGYSLAATNYALKKIREDLQSFDGEVSSNESLMVASRFSRARRLFSLYCMKMEEQLINCRGLADALTGGWHGDFDFLDNVDTLRESGLKFNEFILANGLQTDFTQIKQRLTLSSEIVVGLLMIKYLNTPISLIASEMIYLQHIPLDLFMELWKDVAAMGLTSPKLVHLYLAKSHFPRGNRAYGRIKSQLSEILNVRGDALKRVAAVIRLRSSLDDAKSTVKFLRQRGFLTDEMAKVPHLLAYGVSDVSRALQQPPDDLKSYLHNAKDNVTKLSLLFSYLERERGFEVTYLESIGLSRINAVPN